MKAELIDYMGSDLTVVDSARVSFDKTSDWEYNGGSEDVYLKSKDEKLIYYLSKHNHWTPFSHCMITLRETVPVFVARQRFKHTVGFTYNEVSRRYVSDDPVFYRPTHWRKKADNKKQGSSSETIPVNPAFLNQLYTEVEQAYKKLLEIGVAPEQARMVLPQSMYTSYYVTGSLAAFVRAYKLRSSPDAQQEIQELASQWADIIAPLYPVSWNALNVVQPT